MSKSTPNKSETPPLLDALREQLSPRRLIPTEHVKIAEQRLAELDSILDEFGGNLNLYQQIQIQGLAASGSLHMQFVMAGQLEKLANPKINVTVEGSATEMEEPTDISSILKH